MPRSSIADGCHSTFPSLPSPHHSICIYPPPVLPLHASIMVAWKLSSLLLLALQALNVAAEIEVSSEF